MTVRVSTFFDVRLAKFLIVGVANTVVGLTVIFLAKSLVGFDNVVANMIGYAVGLAVSFALNKQWTFGFHGKAFAALIRFLVVFGVAYVANLATVLALVRYTDIGGYWAQVLGIIPYTALFYGGSRWFAFRA